MTFDMIFMILCLFLGGYGIYTGIRLKQGYDMPITGYTAMPEEDKRYYDDQKVKKYAAIMNIAAGCGLMGCSIFGLLGITPLFFAAVAVFLGAYAWFWYLLKRTGTFIKK